MHGPGSGMAPAAPLEGMAVCPVAGGEGLRAAGVTEVPHGPVQAHRSGRATGAVGAAAAGLSPGEHGLASCRAGTRRIRLLTSPLEALARGGRAAAALCKRPGRGGPEDGAGRLPRCCAVRGLRWGRCPRRVGSAR